MQPSSRRTLLQALAVSLLIHGALVLSPLSPFAEAPNSPALAISAVISRGSRSQPAAPSAQAAPAAAIPGPWSPAAPPARSATETAKVLAQPAADRSSPVAARAATHDPVSPVPSGSPASAGPSSAEATAAAAPLARPAATGEVINADDVRQYSVSLGLAARRFKHYPALARERGWEGRAEIELIFNALSPLPDVFLARSSGRAVLDEQALEMMSQAARVASLPEGLRGRSFRLIKPVEFSLESER